MYLPPMGLIGLIGRMGCGDAVGADEIDGAVEVEVVAGEEEVAEFVVSIECTGEDIRSTDRHRFTQMTGGVVVVGGDESGVIKTGADLGDGAAEGGEGDECGSEK